jgi:tetratricopeptide (TPR) repeat protein
MNSPFSRLRRFVLGIVALLISAYVFRAQVAQALVLRGDDYLYSNRPVEALARYARAMQIDSSLEAAADRFVFVSMERHTRRSIRVGIAAATVFLVRSPHSVALLDDRGLCYLISHEYGRARVDFERAAMLTKRPADYVFAGWAAEHVGDMREARALWHAALASDPLFEPALIALKEHPR